MENSHIFDVNAKAYKGFAYELITEVKKRPILWDKKHKFHGHRRKVANEWQLLATSYNRTAEEVKSKWRNMKDTFHREAKKMVIPPVEERDKSLLEYYTGQWYLFESVLFLWDEDRYVRDNESQEEIYVEVEERNVQQIENIKGEVIDYDDDTNLDNVKDTEFQMTDNIMKTVMSNEETDPIGHGVGYKRKITAKQDNGESRTDKRKRCGCSMTNEGDIDEDLHFAKSLVPFMRKLNPVRKLIVRNEMHSLLLREMLCSNCRSVGPQPDCRCNL